MISIDIGWTTHGWEEAVRGMRNPMNSWSKSDSFISDFTNDGKDGFVLGASDLDLAKRLAVAGNDHSKYRRMITVYADITAPLYWWKEFDTYKVGTVANSCSTMHKIADKEFTIDDFSWDQLLNIGLDLFEFVWDNGMYARKVQPLDFLQLFIIPSLNLCREKYLETKDKTYWWQMIQLLPSSYNQRRTVLLNYQVLNNMYHARKNHKLDEWHDFCHWVESLPYAEELIICNPD